MPAPCRTCLLECLGYLWIGDVFHKDDWHPKITNCFGNVSHRQDVCFRIVSDPQNRMRFQAIDFREIVKRVMPANQNPRSKLFSPLEFFPSCCTPSTTPLGSLSRFAIDSDGGSSWSLCSLDCDPSHDPEGLGSSTCAGGPTGGSIVPAAAVAGL